MPSKVNMQTQMIKGINRLKVKKKLKCDAKKKNTKRFELCRKEGTMKMFSMTS